MREKEKGEGKGGGMKEGEVILVEEKDMVGLGNLGSLTHQQLGEGVKGFNDTALGGLEETPWC